MSVVIIGNGVAGISAAITIRKQDKSIPIQVISNETSHFYSRTALMYIAMGIMRLEDTEPYERNFYKQNNITLINDTVTKINHSSQKIELMEQGSLSYDSLLLATGSVPAMFDWPGQDLHGVVNFITYQDLEKVMSQINSVKRAVVVGGGLIGIELVEVLRHRGIEVTFLIREDTFWPRALSPEEGKIIEKEMAAHGVTVKMSTELKEIHGENGSVVGISTNEDEIISAQLVGITTGVFPNISLAKDSGIPTQRGILVNDFLQTEIKNIFAAGDCVERKNVNKDEPPIISIWYTSRDMGKIAGKNILGDEISYSMGKWYNSAKFFDLEYTSVGHYLPVNNTEKNIYIESKYANSIQTVRLVHQDNIITGFSALGSRWDHEIIQRLIDDKKTIEYFKENYKQAQFNPELFCNDLKI